VRRSKSDGTIGGGVVAEGKGKIAGGSKAMMAGPGNSSGEKRIEKRKRSKGDTGRKVVHGGGSPLSGGRDDLSRGLAGVATRKKAEGRIFNEREFIAVIPRGRNDLTLESDDIEKL